MRTTVIAKQDQESQNLGRLNNLRCNLSVRMTHLECCHGNKTSILCAMLPIIYMYSFVVLCRIKICINQQQKILTSEEICPIFPVVAFKIRTD